MSAAPNRAYGRLRRTFRRTVSGETPTPTSYSGWSASSGARSGYRARDQVSYLIQDLRRLSGGRWFRVWGALFSAPFVAVFWYRAERTLYLAFGRAFVVMRVVLAPVRALLRPLRCNCDLQYTAAIGPGLQVQHPNMGVTLSGRVVMGRNVTIAGGVAIGSRHRGAGPGDVMIGNGVTIGMNAIVLGPLSIGDGAIVGAGAVLMQDVAANDRVAGVPARSTKTRG